MLSSAGQTAGRAAPGSSLAVPRGTHRHALQGRRRTLRVAAALSPGGGKLVDLAAGRRLVAVPQQLEPRNLADVRAAPAFGPRGLLLVGFSDHECAAVRSWFQQMEPGFVVAPCPAALLASGTLADALGSTDGGATSALAERPWEPSPAGTPPVAFFSGISGAEQVGLMEAWSDCTGLDAPAFASVTPTILNKPLSRLLMDIVRAQAQAAPPGMDAEVVAEVQQARAAGAAAAAAAAGPNAGQQPGQAADGSGAAAAAAAAAAEEGGEEVLKSKLQDYVMLDGKEGQTAPMSLDQLKQQIQDKMRAKRVQQAAAEKEARRAADADETDRLRQALRGGKKQQGGKQKKGGGSKGAGKGFGA